MDELQPQELEALLQELEEEEVPTGLTAEGGASSPSDEAVQHLKEAFALEDRDKYEQALAECVEALRLDPTLADAHNLRGVILEELGREKEALLAYREALRLDPSFDAANENLQALEAELAARRRSPLTQKPLCTGPTPGFRRCPHHPIYACQTCGALLCYDHAMFFQVPGDDPSLRAYRGTYCHRHYRDLQTRFTVEEKTLRLFSRLGTLNYWLWGLAYLPICIGATWLVFGVEGELRFWVVVVAWLAGGMLGLMILDRKGYEFDQLGSIFDKLEGCGEALLIPIVLVAPFGPFVLLAALLARSRPSHRESEAAVGPDGQIAHGGSLQGATLPDMSPVCPECQAPNPARDSVCGNCGASLGAAKVMDEAEQPPLRWASLVKVLVIFVIISAVILLTMCGCVYFVMSEATH